MNAVPDLGLGRVGLTPRQHFISTLRVIWFRSANSHTGPQPSSLHQSPDRWQHPTTRQIFQITACVAQGVHRWDADIEGTLFVGLSPLVLTPIPLASLDAVRRNHRALLAPVVLSPVGIASVFLCHLPLRGESVISSKNRLHC